MYHDLNQGRSIDSIGTYSYFEYGDLTFCLKVPWAGGVEKIVVMDYSIILHTKKV